MDGTVAMSNYNHAEAIDAVKRNGTVAVSNYSHDKATVCLFVGWLLIVPATCECISGTDLLRQFYVLPH